MANEECFESFDAKAQIPVLFLKIEREKKSVFFVMRHFFPRDFLKAREICQTCCVHSGPPCSRQHCATSSNNIEWLSVDLVWLGIPFLSHHSAPCTFGSSPVPLARWRPYVYVYVTWSKVAIKPRLHNSSQAMEYSFHVCCLWISFIVKYTSLHFERVT